MLDEVPQAVECAEVTRLRREFSVSPQAGALYIQSTVAVLHLNKFVDDMWYSGIGSR